MSSLPGYDLEDYIAWSYNLNPVDQQESNVSLGIAESLGLSTKPRPVLTKDRFSELVTIFEPVREKVEELLLNFDEENQSWRSYASIFEDYIGYVIERKARAWMVSNGYWEKLKPELIDVPTEYPLAIIGQGNTYKTTLAILLAYQEALLATHLGDREITIITEYFDLNSVASILSPFIKGITTDNFFDVCKSKGIVFTVKYHSSPIGSVKYGSTVIIDEPELFIKGFEGKDIGFIPFVEKLTENDVKVISCHHQSNNRSILGDFKNPNPFKSFFITKSIGDSAKKLTGEEKIEYLSEIPPGTFSFTNAYRQDWPEADFKTLTEKLMQPQLNKPVETITSTVDVRHVYKVTCPICKGVTDIWGLRSFTCVKCCSKWGVSSIDGNSIELKPEQQEDVLCISLMKLDESLTTTPIYVFEVHSQRVGNLDNIDWNHIQERRRYWVEQHTCPTNILGGSEITLGIMYEDGSLNTDPHGILRHVLTKPLNEILEALNLEHPEDTTWQSNETESIINYMLGNKGKLI